MTRADRIEAAIRQIRELYRTGEKIHKALSRPRAGTGRLTAVARTLRITPERARKARQLADPARGYTRRELDDLCAEIRREQSAKADPAPVLGPSHLVRLLTVPRHRRAALQRTAVAAGWSLARLDAEIALRHGIRRAGGRRRRVPADPAAVLVQLEAMCETWRRWHVAAGGSAEHGAARTGLAGLGPDLQQDIAAVGGEIERLQQAVEAELHRLRPGRTDRPAIPGPKGKTAARAGQ